MPAYPGRMGSDGQGKVHRIQFGVYDNGWDECPNRFNPSLCPFANDMGLAYGKNNEIAVDGDLLRRRLVSHCSSQVVVVAVSWLLADHNR